MRQESPPSQPSQPARILIAEDHLDSRDALRILLEAAGYVVTVADDGSKAVDLALNERPDLILMDIMMPVLDGFEATRLLREECGMRGVPIIAFTAMEGAQDRALEAGATAVLRKPLEIHSLLAAINEHLREEDP